MNDETNNDLDELKELMQIQVMMGMRIYDALLILIRQNSTKDSELLAERHERGEWISTYPWVAYNDNS